MSGRKVREKRAKVEQFHNPREERSSCTLLEADSFPASSLAEIDHDLQQETSDVEVQAGISGLKLPLRFSYLGTHLTANISIFTSTSGHRGVHMSRFVSAAEVGSKSVQTIEDYLRNVCREIDETQPGSEVQCDFELPYLDQFTRIKITTSRLFPFSYSFLVNGITSCPCSKRISGVGHMQRATLELDIDSSSPLSPNFFGIITKMGECFSSTPVAFLKRSDEAYVVLKAQENSRFVEDVVRECLKKFQDAKKIYVRSSESIHMHDALAKWAHNDHQKKT